MLSILPNVDLPEALALLRSANLSEAERAAAARSYANGDDEMLAELMDLLDAVGSDRDEDPPDSSDPPQTRRYELKRELGSGATATVFHAWDPAMERDVALKVFHDSGAGRHRDQVVREARAAAGIASDFVVGVHDAGKLPGGKLFIDMQLCGELDDQGNVTPAKALSDLSVAPKSVAQAAKWVKQAALGAVGAHRKRVYHRDLKPDNLILEPVQDRVRVLDFGLAVALVKAEHNAWANEGGKSVSIDRHGLQIAGTPPFMAPEAARGLKRDLNPEVPADRECLTALDIYGLGATLYALIAGHDPYTASPEAENAALNILAQVSAAAPARLHRTRWGTRTPRRLLRIIDRAMHRDPTKRHPSADAFARDLEAFLSHYPSSCDQRRPFLKAALWTRRHWAVVSQVAAVACLLLLAHFSYVWSRDAKQAYDARTQAYTARAVAMRQRDEAIEASKREIKNAGEGRLALFRAEKALHEAETKESEAQIRLEEAEGNIRDVVRARDAARHAQQEALAQADAARAAQAASEEARQLAQSGADSAHAQLEALKATEARLQEKVRATEHELKGVIAQKEAALAAASAAAAARELEHTAEREALLRRLALQDRREESVQEEAAKVARKTDDDRPISTKVEGSSIPVGL